MSIGRRLASAGMALALGGCALLLPHVSSTVAPEPGADSPQLRLTCHASSSGSCHFRYRDVATGVRTEFAVEAGRYLVVSDIPGPAKLCIWTAPVSGFCFMGERDVGPRGLFTVTVKS